MVDMNIDKYQYVNGLYASGKYFSVGDREFGLGFLGSRLFIYLSLLETFGTVFSFG